MPINFWHIFVDTYLIDMKDDIWQQQCNQGVNDTASAVLSRNKSYKNYFCWIKDFEQINITDSSRLGKLFLETRNLMIIRVWLHSGTSIAVAAAAGRAQTCRVSRILSSKVICCTLESYGMNMSPPPLNQKYPTLPYASIGLASLRN